MKLYRYYEDYGRMGSIEGLFFISDERLEKYKEYSSSLYWDELLGKHSEGQYNFSDDTLTLIDIPEEAAEVLREHLGDVISGPFDFDYFDEMVEEAIEEENE